ncbi:MAG TPA: hypothetical protein VHE99_09800 [Gammaproteobacteria bacterium]|nr:hypothetical protein [Gammaproteobacteria bacterium]
MKENNNNTLVDAEEHKHDHDKEVVDQVETVARKVREDVSQLRGQVTTLQNRNNTQFFKPATGEAAKVIGGLLDNAVDVARKEEEKAQELLQGSKLGLSGS